MTKKKKKNQFGVCSFQIFLFLNKLMYSGKIPEIQFSLDNVCFLFCLEGDSPERYVNFPERHLHGLSTTSDFISVLRFLGLQTSQPITCHRWNGCSRMGFIPQLDLVVTVEGIPAFLGCLFQLSSLTSCLWI